MSLSKEPPIINPWLAQGAMAVTTMLVDGTNDPLITLDDQGRWQPVLAERVPTLDNGDVRIHAGTMSIALQLRHGAIWSDNTPVTCDDVVFTWKTAMNPKWAIASRLGWDHITSITCPNVRSVRIEMDEPYAMYRSRILALGPLPEHVLRGSDFNTVWNDRVTVSSGPYVFKRWQRGVRLDLVRNDRYWGGDPARKPLLDHVAFRFVKDANTLKMQLQMTEADVALLPADTNLMEELRATPDTSFRILPGAVVELLVLNTDRPPLDDVHVRRALEYAIDRTMISKVVLKGQAPVIDQSTVPAQTIYRSHSFDRYRPNLRKVSRELTAAGYKRSGSGPWMRAGKELRLGWVAGAGSMPFRTRVAQLVQEQLRRQGIGIDITLITPEVLYSDVAPRGNFHIGEWSELTGVEPAPELLFGCDQIPKAPSWAGKNRFRWCDRRVDALMREADTVVDPEDRARLLATIDEQVAQAAPVLPLFQSPDVIAWNRSVHGLKPNPFSGHTWNIEQWWVSR